MRFMLLFYATMFEREERGIQEWDVKSSDGRAIYGRFRKPEGDGPFAAMILIHGGMGDNPEYTRAMLDWTLADRLVEDGFVVCSTDYRVDHAGKDINDVVAAFESAAKMPFVDERKIAYFGDSHGAYIALMAATRTSPFALIHGWGVADMADWYWHIKNIPASYYRKVCEDFEKSLGGTPDHSPKAYRRISPTSHVASIRCPILILHGEEDREVPVSHAHKLAEAVGMAGGECELKIFKDAGHGLRSSGARKAMDRLVLEFLNRYLKI